MDYDEFRLLHSDLIGLFQLIESDLKWIFSIIEKGDVDDNFSKIEKFNLGKIIKDLKSLVKSVLYPFISANDYNFLKQMKDKRNYWCHECFLDFMYVDSWENSKEFNDVCRKLAHDYQKTKIVQRNVQEVKLKANKEFRGG